MVGPTASLTPGSPPALAPPPPLGTLSLALSLSLSLSFYRLVLPAEKDRRKKKKKRERERANVGTREGRGRRGRAEVAEVSAPPHRQCLTSVAVARPPRDESITLNNVNVSPSQHKTNNHCSLPRPMGTACSRGSPAPHSPFCLCLFPPACLTLPLVPPFAPHAPVLAGGAPPSSCFSLFVHPSVRPSVRFSAYLRLRGLIKKSPLTAADVSASTYALSRATDDDTRKNRPPLVSLTDERALASLSSISPRLFASANWLIVEHRNPRNRRGFVGKNIFLQI